LSAPESVQRRIIKKELMKGEILMISGKEGIIQYDDDRQIPYVYHTELRIGDLVEFEILQISPTKENEPTFVAVIKSIWNSKKPISRKELRLSRAAGILNVGIKHMANVLIKHGFDIEPSPNYKISEEQFLLLEEHFRNEKAPKKKKIKPTYELGTVFESKIKQIIKPSLIILEYTSDKDAFLHLQNIAWNIPRSENVIKSVKVGEKLRVVLTDENERYAVVSKRLLLPRPSETDAWEKLRIGDELEGSIQEILVNTIIVNTDLGFIASLPKFLARENDEKIGTRLSFILAGKDEDLQRLILTRKEIEKNEWDDKKNTKRRKEDFEPQQLELRTLSAFKNSIYYTYATPEDQQFIEKAFQNNSKLFYSSLVFDDTIYFKFAFNSPAWENDFKNKLLPYLSSINNSSISEAGGLKYLSDQPYWIRLNSWDTEEGKKYNWSLFNEKIYLAGFISFENDDCLFLVRDLSIDRTKKKTTDNKDKNQRNGSILLMSDLKIVSPYQNIPFESSHKKTFSILEDKITALHLLNRLRREAGVILRDEGLSLQIFDKFLEFQENVERKGKDESRIFVESFRQVPALKTKIAIEIKNDISDFITDTETETHLVSIKTVESAFKEDEDEIMVWFADAFCDVSDERTVLNIKGEEINLEKLNSGFYLEKKVSLTQFKIQREVIKDFFDKKINLDHIESLLLRPDKITPPITEEIKFIDPQLEETARLFANNNQVNAIRKAVGNRNIFLIQGPPGTGKTTIIAEIIGQLAKRGEKILVSSQTHVAVDNVLKKVSKNKDLTCMRLGNIQRMTEDLQPYHIDVLKKIYIKDFAILTELHIDLASAYKELNKENQSYEVNKLKDKIREHSVQYSENLRDFLTQRDFEFLETVKSLKNESIDLLLDLLKDWRSNIESQKEYILTPIIYRSIDVVFATCIGIRTDKDLNNLGIKFDTVIIDEAGKANLSESLVAIAMAEKVILVGDQMQLPPYIDSNLLDDRDQNSFPCSKYGKDFTINNINHALKTSFFEFLINRIQRDIFPKENYELLNFQYRMHPHIGEFISESFYEGKVKMGETTYKNKLYMPPPFDKEVIFIDTSSSENPFESGDGFSARNDTEAYCISNLILPKLFENGLDVRNLAIVAPYKSQVSLIKRNLSSANLGYSGEIVVSTLDSFQGMEFDVLIFSFTRSIPKGQIKRKVGFLDDARRLNVAFSRAKKKLILVGNAVTLTDSNCHFDGLYNYTELFKKLVFLGKNQTIGNFVNITDYGDLKSTFNMFMENHPIGQRITGIHKSSMPFGHFFTLPGNIDVLFYDPYGIFSFSLGEEYYLDIVDYNTEKKQIGVKPHYDDGFFETMIRLVERRSIYEFKMGKYEKLSKISVRINTRIFTNPDVNIICYCKGDALSNIIRNDRKYKAKFIGYNKQTKLIAFEHIS
jgi:superfamily I DNA and/or RNA helicase